jgi:choline transport protein
MNRIDYFQGGIPFRSYFVHIDEKRQFPLRTTLAAAAFVCIYGLLLLASSTPFNSIIASSVLFLNITFAIPQAFIAARGKGKLLPTRPLNLRKPGYFVNLFSVVLTLLIIVFACFPSVRPLSIQNMNYCSVIIAGIFAILIILWFAVGNRKFVGPKLEMDSPSSE